MGEVTLKKKLIPCKDLLSVSSIFYCNCSNFFIGKIMAEIDQMLAGLELFNYEERLRFWSVFRPAIGSLL